MFPRKDRWVKDVAVYLSMRPDVFHETHLSGIGMHGRILFAWRGGEIRCVHWAQGKEGQEDNVISEIGHWPSPWTCMGAPWERRLQDRLCTAASVVATVGKGFVGGTKHQMGEPEQAEEHEENTYANVWHPL